MVESPSSSVAPLVERLSPPLWLELGRTTFLNGFIFESDFMKL